MSLVAKTCYIRTCEDSLLNVFLPDGAPVILGRCPETNIVDKKCSRQQVRLCANYTEHTVFVQQIGTRASGLNGFSTRKDVKYVARHDDRIEILYGKYSYQVEFNPPPPTMRDQISKKRPLPLEAEDSTNRNSCKMAKSEDAYSMDVHYSGEDDNSKEAKRNSSVQKELKDENMSCEEEGGTSSTTTKSWESINNGDLLIYTAPGVQSRSKVAAYDMDGTLIKTRSSLVFPKDCNDWQLLYLSIPGKLKKIHSEGYKVVIFTNQGRLGSGKTNVKDFKLKIERVVQRLSIPIQVFIATVNGIYRKPAIGMWTTLENDKNDGIPIDTSQSFYVGDAAGRQKNWAPGKKKDHSSVDRLLALNLGLKFETPDEHFLGQKAAPFVMPAFNPKNLSQDGDICNKGSKVTQSKQEIILMVGCPGSGKSHFAKHYLKDYEYVNRDSLGSWQKCVSAMEKFLAEGKSVVIDNTNPDPASRQRYVEAAKKHSVPVRCFVMTTSMEHAKHNNKFRQLTDPTHIKITEMIINSYIKNYVPPSLEENFDEIVEVNFIPKFESEENRTLYEMYLLES